MAKKILAIFFLFIFFAAATSSIFSQDFDFKKSYEDYLFALNNYRQDYSQFKNARDFYLQTKTLGLKESARKELAEMLISRDELLAVYLSALRMRLIETPEHPGSERGDILSDLPGEVAWWRDHKNKYNKDSDTLENLFAKNEEALAEYEGRTTRLTYTTLATIAFSKYIDFKILHENIYKDIKPRIDKLDGSRRDLFERWITDTDSEFQKVTDLEIEAKAIRDKLKTTTKDDSKESYTELVGVLSKGVDSLKKINGYLQEMEVALNK